MKVRRAILVLMGALLLLAGVLHFTGRKAVSHASVETAKKEPAPVPAASLPAMTQVPPPTAPVVNHTEPDEKIDERISAILTDETISHRQAAEKLFALIPSASSTAQQELANHVLNLSDEDFDWVWVQKLVDNSLPTDAADVLFTGLYNRPQELLMETLAAIAEQPGHPKHSQSVETLEVLLGPIESGQTWSSKVDAYFKQPH